jgi:hypothetical protein
MITSGFTTVATIAWLLQVLLVPANLTDNGMVATIEQRFDTEEECLQAAPSIIPHIINDYIRSKFERPGAVKFICVLENAMLPGTEETRPDPI